MLWISLCPQAWDGTQDAGPIKAWARHEPGGTTVVALEVSQPAGSKPPPSLGHQYESPGDCMPCRRHQLYNNIVIITYIITL